VEADGLIWAVDECFTVPAKAQSDREVKVNVGGIVVFLETDLSCIVIATAVVDSNTEHLDRLQRGSKQKEVRSRVAIDLEKRIVRSTVSCSKVRLAYPLLCHPLDLFSILHEPRHLGQSLVNLQRRNGVKR
jgi:hypothetical protein